MPITGSHHRSGTTSSQTDCRRRWVQTAGTWTRDFGRCPWPQNQPWIDDGRDGHLSTDRGGVAFGTASHADGTPRNGRRRPCQWPTQSARPMPLIAPHTAAGQWPCTTGRPVGLHRLRQTPADFVMQHHAPQRRRTVKTHGRGNRHRVEIVAAKFASGMTKPRVGNRSWCRWSPIHARPNSWPRWLSGETEVPSPNRRPPTGGITQGFCRRTLGRWCSSPSPTGHISTHRHETAQ